MQDVAPATKQTSRQKPKPKQGSIKELVPSTVLADFNDRQTISESNEPVKQSKRTIATAADSVDIADTADVVFLPTPPRRIPLRLGSVIPVGEYIENILVTPEGTKVLSITINAGSLTEALALAKVEDREIYTVYYINFSRLNKVAPGKKVNPDFTLLHHESAGNDDRGQFFRFKELQLYRQSKDPKGHAYARVDITSCHVVDILKGSVLELIYDDRPLLVLPLRATPTFGASLLSGQTTSAPPVEHDEPSHIRAASSSATLLLAASTGSASAREAMPPPRAAPAYTESSHISAGDQTQSTSGIPLSQIPNATAAPESFRQLMTEIDHDLDQFRVNSGTMSSFNADGDDEELYSEMKNSDRTEASLQRMRQAAQKVRGTTSQTATPASQSPVAAVGSTEYKLMKSVSYTKRQLKLPSEILKTVNDSATRRMLEDQLTLKSDAVKAAVDALDSFRRDQAKHSANYLLTQQTLEHISQHAAQMDQQTLRLDQHAQTIEQVRILLENRVPAPSGESSLSTSMVMDPALTIQQPDTSIVDNHDSRTAQAGAPSGDPRSSGDSDDYGNPRYWDESDSELSDTAAHKRSTRQTPTDCPRYDMQVSDGPGQLPDHFPVVRGILLRAPSNRRLDLSVYMEPQSESNLRQLAAALYAQIIEQYELQDNLNYLKLAHGSGIDDMNIAHRCVRMHHILYQVQTERLNWAYKHMDMRQVNDLANLWPARLPRWPAMGHQPFDLFWSKPSLAIRLFMLNHYFADNKADNFMSRRARYTAMVVMCLRYPDTSSQVPRANRAEHWAERLPILKDVMVLRLQLDWPFIDLFLPYMLSGDLDDGCRPLHEDAEGYDLIMPERYHLSVLHGYAPSMLLPVATSFIIGNLGFNLQHLPQNTRVQASTYHQPKWTDPSTAVNAHNVLVSAPANISSNWSHDNLRVPQEHRIVVVGLLLATTTRLIRDAFAALDNEIVERTFVDKMNGTALPKVRRYLSLCNIVLGVLAQPTIHSTYLENQEDQVQQLCTDLRADVNTLYYYDAKYDPTPLLNTLPQLAQLSASSTLQVAEKSALRLDETVFANERKLFREEHEYADQLSKKEAERTTNYSLSMGISNIKAEIQESVALTISSAMRETVRQALAQAGISANMRSYPLYDASNHMIVDITDAPPENLGLFGHSLQNQQSYQQVTGLWGNYSTPSREQPYHNGYQSQPRYPPCDGQQSGGFQAYSSRYPNSRGTGFGYQQHRAPYPF